MSTSPAPAAGGQPAASKSGAGAGSPWPQQGTLLELEQKDVLPGILSFLFRGWFTSGSATALPGPGLSTMDSGSGDKDRSSADKWSLFGPRSLPKSESGGFAIQAYKGAQKPSPMEVMRGQATRRTEEPATFKPPKMDIPVMEGTKQLPRAHSLKPRDLNVLTPTGF